MPPSNSVNRLLPQSSFQVAAIVTLVLSTFWASQAHQIYNLNAGEPPVAKSKDAAKAIVTSPPPKPFGYWSFDSKSIKGSTATDISGNQHDGTILKGKIVAGKVGTGLEISGTVGGVTIEEVTAKGNQRTVSLWIKPYGGEIQRLIYFDGMNQVGFVGSSIFVHTGRIGRADTNLPYVELGITKREWSHLAVTWNTSLATKNVKIYVNGTLAVEGTLNKAKQRPLVNDVLRIGHHGEQSEQVFQGVVDEVAIYDRELSSSQIKNYFQRVSKSKGESAIVVPREVVSQSIKPVKPYFPKETFHGRKKLIRIGSELGSRLLDSPSIAEARLPDRVKAWQATGLDGLVFSLATHRKLAAGEERNMTGLWWHLVKRDYDEFIPEIKAFQSVENWGRLTDNFLWSSMAIWGGGPNAKCQNWFNDADWEIVLSNARLHARIARESGFKGILLDTEQYDGHHGKGAWHFPFSYRIYKEDSYELAGESKPRSFKAVVARVRQRGEQYTRTLCQEFPGVRIIVIPGLYDNLGRGKPENIMEGLRPAFLDGMLMGLDDNAKLINGQESTYDMTEYTDISHARRQHDETLRKLSKVPFEIKRKVSFAAGIWADTGRVWSDKDVGVNLRSPKEHATAVRNALRVSGEYAWLYGEQSRFLTKKPTPLLREYFKANVDAHNLKPVNDKSAKSKSPSR